MAVPLVSAGVAGFQIISGLQQADMVGKQAEIQKQIDDFNAGLAEFDAWKAEAFGQTMMAEYQQQIDQAQAAARVSAAAAGVSSTEGSIAEVIQQNEMIGLANQLEIENQARERALGYTRQARSIRIGSQISQAQAKSQQASIVTGSLLRAAGTVGSSLMGMKSKPSPTGSESGYSLPSIQSTPGSYLTGSSEDLGGTGYLGLP